MLNIINGKENTERIVSIEPNGSSCELFIQNENGSIQSKFVENFYWLLAPKYLDRDFVRLDGDLYYKYGKKYDIAEAYYSDKGRYRYKDVFSIPDPKEAFLVNFGYTYYKNLKIDEISILSFDIETTSLSPKDKDAKVLIIANTLRKNGITTRKLFTYLEYNTPAELINDWCKWVRERDPSVICGHNILMFDLPYLDAIANLNGTSLELGRDGSFLTFNNYLSKFRKDSSQFYEYKKIKVYGREIVDTFFLSIKHDAVARRYLNYKLKNIINQEGLEVPGRVFYDGEQIRFKYKDPIEWEKIKLYSIFDGDDALALFDLMAPPIFYFTQSAPRSFQSMCETASGGQINSLLVRSYLQEGHSIPKADDIIKFEGAISIGIPGIYKNVLSFDVSSLYPSVMLTYDVFPSYKDPKGHMRQILKYFTEQRLADKKKAKETGDVYYDNLSNSRKIVINSMYGLLGAKLNFNSPADASLVTYHGRETLKQAIKWATGREFDQWKIDNNINTDADTDIDI